MLTAHLPSGYIVGRLVPRFWRPVPKAMPVALVAAVLPDFDMIWFYLVDNGRVHHHRYWVHVPPYGCAPEDGRDRRKNWQGFLQLQRL